MTGFQHQCLLPPIWFTRLIGSRIGRNWHCPVCAKRWRLGYMRFPAMLPGAPLIHEWKEAT